MDLEDIWALLAELKLNLGVLLAELREDLIFLSFFIFYKSIIEVDRF